MCHNISQARHYNAKYNVEIVSKNLDKVWDFEGLSQNSNITWKIVSKNLNKP